MSSARTELATAVRRVNAAYSRLGDPGHLDVLRARWLGLEREVDVALAAGDDHAALAAIEAWRDHALAAIDRALVAERDGAEAEAVA